MKKLLILSAAACLFAGSAFAAPKDKSKTPTKPKAAKLIEVKVCPVTGEAVSGSGGGSEVYGKYKVNFCCAGCKPEFDKMSAKDKDAKIAATLKKPDTKAAPKKG